MADTTYRVAVTYADAGARDDAQLATVAETLGDGALCAADGATLTVRCTILAAGLADAAAAGLAAVAAACREHLGDVKAPAAVEVATEQYALDQAGAAAMPGAMGSVTSRGG